MEDSMFKSYINHSARWMYITQNILSLLSIPQGQFRSTNSDLKLCTIICNYGIHENLTFLIITLRRSYFPKPVGLGENNSFKT